ncbi:ribonuclease Y [Thermoleophilia bacterium SCSIO 60948]|nr:ribonuclease Y [Thermoleophilia bacterium SCSIO 60948]
MRATIEAERRTLDDARDELRARREEITRIEERTLAEARSAELTRADLERRSQALTDRERNLETQAEELKQAKRKQRRELEKLSSLSASEAKQMLLADVEHEARHLAGLRVLEVEAEAKRDAERRARSILAVATQRLASSHAGETTTRLVELPSDEMKGRVIGRDGRNIRALEKLTGVDIIVDETPSAITLSSFDGVRREIARITLERLIADGRIHPVQIEETYAKASKEVAESIAREGERAALEAGVEGLHPDLLETLGRLRYRTSYGQNVLDHLVECAHLAAMIAAELGASVQTARRGALLHDIGKAVSHESGGGHAEIGARLARRRGESEAIVHAIEAHHNETDPRTVEAVIVQAADAVSGARPGARGDALEQYVARLRDLEEIAERHYGVERVYAMRAGREVRVIVDPGKVSDEEAALISKEVASAIEGEVEFPGQIRITVVRETRSTSVAG